MLSLPLARMCPTTRWTLRFWFVRLCNQTEFWSQSHSTSRIMKNLHMSCFDQCFLIGYWVKNWWIFLFTKLQAPLFMFTITKETFSNNILFIKKQKTLVLLIYIYIINNYLKKFKKLKIYFLKIFFFYVFELYFSNFEYFYNIFYFFFIFSNFLFEIPKLSLKLFFNFLKNFPNIYLYIY